MPKNCVFTRFGNISLVVHSAVNPSIEEWDTLMEFYKSGADEFSGVLVYTNGGSPNATQRKRLRDVFGARLPPASAILTSSMPVRMVITAINLFLNNRVRAIDQQTPEAALDYLGVFAKEERAELLQALTALALSIGVKTPASYSLRLK
jgi:hypothetical protein